MRFSDRYSDSTIDRDHDRAEASYDRWTHAPANHRTDRDGCCLERCPACEQEAHDEADDSAEPE